MGLIGPGHQLCAGGVHTQWPRGTMRPVASASGTNSSGESCRAPACASATALHRAMTRVWWILGLEVQLEVLLLQPLAHGCFQLHPRLDAGLHAGRIEMRRIAPRNFGLVHRQVGAFEQLVGAIALALKQRDADADGAVLRALAHA